MLIVTEEQVWIDTYPEAERQELPMFAENRVHQRTSGNPYPNKVVLEAQRDTREKRPYTLLRLENDYLEIGILPALGGKIWYARDKKKDYGFFYKNNVVKPALIGVLGSWTSGGLEFNWPFHHRASTFMPVDYHIERGENYAIVWLSEHEPIDRMKGMVGVCLYEDECIFETRVKLDNTSPLRHSFLWWENAAVPVDENYEIFFPEDVNYVRFHYKRSVTTYPIANNRRFGAFNGIYYPGDTDISKHKNTRKATSYFSAESQFDYFGGYDQKKAAGVVHVADHHISPGKKMFTWAYEQLSKTWENALTDSDGQYAELMAGCYSDNQPDLTWILPGETRQFSQRWFPIHDNGIPTFANENGALYWNENGITLQCVRPFANATVTVNNRDGELFSQTLALDCYTTTPLSAIPCAPGLRVCITQGKKTLFDYTVAVGTEREIPDVRRELPDFRQVPTAQQLYLEGLHAEQYRSPEYSAEAFYLEALERESDFAPALTSLAECALRRLDYEKALDYILRAERSATRFNIRLESGRIYYLKGLSLLGLRKYGEACDALHLAAWSYDYRLSALLRIGLLDLRRGDLTAAEEHFSEVLSANAKNVIAPAFLGYVKHLLQDASGADAVWQRALACDPLNLYVLSLRAVAQKDFSALCNVLCTDATQVVMDVVELLHEASLTQEIAALITGIRQTRPLNAIAEYALAAATGKAAQKAPVGIAFPSRPCEYAILENALAQDPSDREAAYLLACLCYGKGLYQKGISILESLAKEEKEVRVLRNLAVGYYSHTNEPQKALACMEEAVSLAPAEDKQITFEAAHLMAKQNLPAERIAQMILSRGSDRDDVTVELARAYNHMGEADRAISLLLSRPFVACEGGEHAIADQYMYAHYLKGKKAYLAGDYETALSVFETAQILPQSLGAGLWNDIKKVPYAYFAARCLEKLGRAEEAKEIYRSFSLYNFDYFTDMYLYTFAYYAARALQLLGKGEEAEALLRKRQAEFSAAAVLATPGYFGTTPFFISFIDPAERARALHYAYPLYLFATCLGEKEEAARQHARMENDGYALYIEDFTL